MKTAEEIMDECNNSYGSGLDWDDVEKAIHTYAEQFKPKWVSVKEILPESLTSVLCCLKNKYIVQLTYGTLSGFMEVASGQYIKESNPVTHWMPLPEPPNDQATSQP